MNDSSVPATLLWVGRILSGIAVLFLLMDSIGKILRVRQVIEGSTLLGFPESSVVGIGLTLLACTLLYVYPGTAVIGALLITGFLGGAVAAQVRIQAPWLTHALFPVYVACFVWGGLLLRDPRLKAFIPGM